MTQATIVGNARNDGYSAVLREAVETLRSRDHVHVLTPEGLREALVEPVGQLLVLRRESARLGGGARGARDHHARESRRELPPRGRRDARQ